ncbi:MAG: hypothetical protein QOG45_1307 [Chloroflexota bacterium]|nr:hypothetical protein [Chloroflexota bacterium]
MRLRSSPLVLGLIACTASGTMALTSTTAFASSHGSHSAKTTKVSVHGSNNCTVVGNNNTVHCTTVSHRHRGNGDNNGDFGRHHGGILEGVGDILGGVLGAL